MKNMNLLAVILLTVIVMLSNFSCAKLEERQQTEIISEKLASADSVPAKWGNLVSVSSAPKIENWVQLWFQDEEGNIRMIPYNIAENRLLYEAKVIRRN